MSDQWKEIIETSYYRRLAKIELWPLLVYISVVLVSIVSLIVVFYLRYLPALLLSVHHVLPSPEVLAFLEARISKIVIIFSVLIFVSFLFGVRLVYVVWDVKNLLAHLQRLANAMQSPRDR